MVGLAGLACGIFFMAEKSARPERQPYYERRLEAAKLALTARKAIQAYERETGISIDLQDDPFGTGLLGQDSTEITTGKGDFESAVLSTNPNVAAAFVDMLFKAYVPPHSTVAVGLNGSYPGLNISFFAACYALDLRPIIIASAGASGWGANRPALTWLDMERILRERDIFPYKSIAASIGGRTENGDSLTPEGRDLLREAIRRNSVMLIEEESLQAHVDRRMQIYKKECRGRRIACYVNIGGGAASLGGTQKKRLIPRPGTTRPAANQNLPTRGVINLMSRDGIPVVNVLNVRKISAIYGLPRKVPEKEPAVGEGNLYFTKRDPLLNTLLLACILVVVVVVLIITEMRSNGSGAIPFTKEDAE